MISSSLFFFFFNLFIYIWLCWVFITALRRYLVAMSRDDSLTGFSFWGAQALERGLSGWGTGAWLLHGLWDLVLPPGIQSATPALEG